MGDPLPKSLIRTDKYTTRMGEYRTGCVGQTGLYVPPDPGGVVCHYPLPTLGGQCPSFTDPRIEFAMKFDMKRPPLSAGISFTQPYEGLWLISLFGRHVGTVEGNSVVGFTARDIDYHFIGRDTVSAKAAMQAWVP